MTTEKKQESMKMIIIALLALNLLLGVYVSFFKRDALWLETLKAWWAANMTMAKQLYMSPVYIQQQKSTLEQILGSMNQAQSGTTAPTAATTQPTVTPTVK